MNDPIARWLLTERADDFTGWIGKYQRPIRQLPPVDEVTAQDAEDFAEWIDQQERIRALVELAQLETDA